MDTAAIAEFEEFLRLYHDNVIMRMYKERAEEYLTILQPATE
jgi:hypothetical protein